MPKSVFCIYFIAFSPVTHICVDTFEMRHFVLLLLSSHFQNENIYLITNNSIYELLFLLPKGNGLVLLSAINPCDELQLLITGLAQFSAQRPVVFGQAYEYERAEKD